MCNQPLSKATAHLVALKKWESIHYKYKLPDVAIEILLYLSAHRDKSTTHKQLYKSLPTTLPTSIRWLKRLHQDGLVSLKPVMADRRVFHLQLTPMAQRFLIEYSKVASGKNCGQK
jgi:DNA-binding MarR family transcriptional regulator